KQTVEPTDVTKEMNKAGTDVDKVGISSSSVNDYGVQDAYPNENGNELVGNEFGPISYVNVVHTEPMSPMNEGEKFGNNHVNEFPLYATKLSPTSSTKAYLWKLEANVSNDADYDVWLPLASVHEVNDIMKNSLYGYFIGKRFAFPLWNGLCETIGKSMDSRKLRWKKVFSSLSSHISRVLIMCFTM
ncbi:hypothetical protein Tco_1118659, partial [Tanacetum coccineum]